MPATTNTKRKSHNPYQGKRCCNLSINDILAVKIKNKNKTSPTLVLPVHQTDSNTTKSQEEIKVIVEHPQHQEQEQLRRQDAVSDQTNTSMSSLLPPAPRSSRNNNNNNNTTTTTTNTNNHFIFSGIRNLCPDPGFDILRVDYATGLSMPGIFDTAVPPRQQDGKLKTKIVLGHLPHRLIKEHGIKAVLGVLGAIVNPLGIPIYSPELDVAQGVFMFSTEDSCSCHAITALQGRVLFDVDCFWYAASEAGVQVMDRWCKMMKHFVQTRPQVLDRDLPLTAMTAFVHRYCFLRSEGTVFPLAVNQRQTMDHHQQQQNNNKNKKNRISFSWCDHEDSWNFFQSFYQENLHVLKNQRHYQYPQGEPVSCPLDHHHDKQQVVDNFQRAAEQYFLQHH